MTQFSDIAPADGFDLTGDPFIDSLFAPEDFFRTKWASVSDGKTAVSYSFPFLNGVASRFTADYGGENTANQHFGVTNAQVPGIDLAFQRWADVANLKFTKVTETAGGVVGDIRIAFSSEVSSDFWGYAKIFSDGEDPSHGDIWIEPGIAPGTFQPFTYDFTAIMHEIGHALGLDHPFEGNIIPDGYDDMRFTIMAYNTPKNVFYFNGTNPEAEFLITTPGVYDIAAVQAIYGANMLFNTGDDTYTYQPDRPLYATIWDAGGKDTFDVSAFTKACSISLLPGTYSQLGYDGTDLDPNIGIAFKCTIENVNGGAGDDTLTGNDASNTINGNDGGDIIFGGSGNDRLDGGADSDRLIGDAGNDTIIGGQGNDTLSFETARAAVKVNLAASKSSSLATGDLAQVGTDTIVGGIEAVAGSAFDDRLTGDANANTFYGETGNDTLIGGAGADQLAGGAGNDTISGGAGDDGLQGGDGNDALSGGSGDDYLIGNAGSDTLTGGAGNDSLIGAGGNDTFLAGADPGNDTFIAFGAGSFDTLSYASARAAVKVDMQAGTASGLAVGDIAQIGSDSLTHIEAVVGSAFADKLSGSVGNDTLTGGGGNDRLIGGAGVDTASYATAASAVAINLAILASQDTLGAGEDRISSIENLTGSAFNDKLTGNMFGNVLSGGTGSDQLSGGAGSDRLIGGAARDLLTGGTGADTFRFGNGDFGGFTSSTCDRILDFSRAEGDRIDLSAVDANTMNGIGNPNDAFTFITGAFGKVAGQLRAMTTAGVTLLQGDTNGDGVADVCIRFEGAPTLMVGDFLL